MSVLDDISRDGDVADYMACLRASGRRQATLNQYAFVIRQWLDFLGTTPVAEAARADAYAWLEKLQQEYKPGGNAARLRVMRALYAWLETEEIVERNPFRKLTIKVPEEIRETPDETSIDAMIERARNQSRNLLVARDVALLTVLADTGARKTEIGNLQWADVDITSGTITIRVSKSRARVVPLSDRAVKALVRWMRRRGTRPGALWSTTGAGGGPALVRHLVETHSRHTLTPHALRRAFAVRWLAKGGSESGLMRICGWSSAEMIRVYTRAKADDLAAQEFHRLYRGAS
jgi:integrase